MSRDSSPIRKAVVGIVAGTGVAQLILLFSLPILTRFYTPSDFGVLSVITALAGVLGSVCCLRFDLAVPLPAEQRMASALLRLGCTSALLLCSGCFALVILFDDWFIGHLPIEVLPWMWAFPITALLASLSQILVQVSLRCRLYGVVAKQNVVRTVCTVIPQIASVGITGPFGLVLGPVVGQAGSLSYLWPKVRAVVSRVNWAECIGALRTYWRFPLFLTPAALFNSAGLQVPLLLIASHYGSDVAGFLGVTQRLLLIPMTIVGQAVAQVYIGELTQLVRLELAGAHTIFVRTSKRLSILAAGGVLLTLLVSPLIELVLGPDWAPSVQYMRVLAIAVAAQLVVYPVSQTLIALNRPGLQFLWDFARFVVVICAVGLTIYAGCLPISSVVALSLSSAVMYGILWLTCLLVVSERPPGKRVD